MLRTHYAITVLAILLFLPNISNKIIFVLVALAVTPFPDIDTAFSTLGKHKLFSSVQFLTKHRGVLHSLTFCAVASVVVAFFYPPASLPFFLAYSLHLFADSYTREGIRPFWPIKEKSSWVLKTGGLKETSLFVFLVITDVLVFVFLIKGVF